MATERQRQANRRNARRSTGPRTGAGKERSRFNALRHGLAAQSPVLPHENAAAFHETRAALIAHYEPANIQELQLVDHIAQAQIRMERSRRFENGMFNVQLQHTKRTYGQSPDPRTDDDTGIAACMCSPEFELGYKTLFRYDSRAEASYFKAVNALHRVREARLKQEERSACRTQAVHSAAQTRKLASFGASPTQCVSDGSAETKLSAPAAGQTAANPPAPQPVQPGDAPDLLAKPGPAQVGHATTAPINTIQPGQPATTHVDGAFLTSPASANRDSSAIINRSAPAVRAHLRPHPVEQSRHA